MYMLTGWTAEISSCVDDCCQLHPLVENKSLPAAVSRINTTLFSVCKLVLYLTPDNTLTCTHTSIFDLPVQFHLC